MPEQPNEVYHLLELQSSAVPVRDGTAKVSADGIKAEKS
jgi:hypothetical protein